MQIVRKKLTPTEITPKSIRYNSGTDTVQSSPDNGVTWVDDPTQDPRTSTIYQLPADPTSNPKCDAAERAINQLRDEINAVINATSIVGAVTLLFDLILVFVPVFGIIADVIWLAVEALLAIGTIAISVAFTDAVYANLKCLWSYRVGSDGIMTSDGLTAWLDDVSAAYPTDATIASTISILVDKFGLVQLNNAAVKRTETGDCSACAAHCFQIDLTAEDGSTWGVSAPGGHYVSGTGWVGDNFGSLNYSDVTLLWTFPITLTLTNAEMSYTKTAGSGTNDANALRILKPVVNYATTNIFQDNFNGLGANVGKNTILDDVDADGYSIDLNSGTAVTDCIISKLIVRYNGDIPSGWSDNCE